MLHCLRAVTAVLVLATLAPISRSKRWWIRDLDFPRLQLAALLGAVLCAQQGRRVSWAERAATLACLAQQARWILPYTRLHPKQVPAARRPGRRLRIMTANVLGPNRRSADFLRVVRDADPDVLVTLESNRWWEGQLSVLEERYPYTVKCPLENLYGMHVYSKLPLRDARIRFLVEPDIPSIHAFAELPEGGRVELHFLHPEPPRPATDSSESRDAELILVAKELGEEDRPIVVAGDLNDVAWSRTTRRFLKVSGLLDPRVGRRMLNTFHAGWWPARWPLDHVFHSRHFELSRLRRLPSFGSDHFPVLVELSLARA
jgi:endonuclease/exonuclease/phosphatase (EEP) superfamily protein YafD